MPPGYYKLPAKPPAQPEPTQPAWAWNPGGAAPSPTGPGVPFGDPGAWMPVGTPEHPVDFTGLTTATPMSTEEIRDRRQAYRVENMKPAEQDARAREQHVNALTVGQPAKKHAYQMTWAEYGKLTPEQKAAVDWNTLLVRAVRSDRSSQDEYGTIAPRQQTAYDQAIESTFGNEDRGSRIYAPETLGLLQQIGYKDDSGDLDDFLKLRAAITTEDLQVVPESSGVGAVSFGPTHNLLQAATTKIGEQFLSDAAMHDLGPYGQVLQMQRDLVGRTTEMEATLAKGNQMMATVAQTAEADRNEIVTALGGSAFSMPKNMVGYEPPRYITNPTTGQQEAADLNTAFRDTFDMLSNPAYQTDRDKILAAFNSAVTPDEYDAFLSYANARSSTAAQLGAPLGNVEGGHYISPRDFRVAFGLVKPGPAAGTRTPPRTAPQQQQQYTKEAPPYG
jgi:hypothetical protein